MKTFSFKMRVNGISINEFASEDSGLRATVQLQAAPDGSGFGNYINVEVPLEEAPKLNEEVTVTISGT